MNQLSASAVGAPRRFAPAAREALSLSCRAGVQFDRSSAIDTLIDRFDGDIRRILEQLAGEALVSAEILADELDEYLEDFSSSSLHMEFVDREKAERCTNLCRGLLDALDDDATERQHRLTQLAVNYYVLAEDAADDKHSLAGFDDDLEVVEAVVQELGLNHLLENQDAH